MTMDGDTYVFRTERHSRSQPVRPAAPAPYPGPDTQAPRGQAVSERINRLESAISRLEGALSHLEGLIGSRRSEHGRSASVVSVNHDRDEEDEGPGVRVLRMEQLGQPAPPSEPAYVSPDVKVSLYTGGSATAILGQVRIHNDE